MTDNQEPWRRGAGPRRVSTRILIADRWGKNYLTPINYYNEDKGLFGIDAVPIGCHTVWPFGDYQTHHDMRKRQMNQMTILNTYKGHISTSKGYIIISISKGIIHGVPDNYNGYLMQLQRVS